MKIILKRLLTTLISVSTLSTVLPAKASEEIHTNLLTPQSHAYDLGSPAEDFYIWHGETAKKGKLDSDAWFCESGSNPKRGACHTTWQADPDQVDTEITLEFEESRSKVTQTLKIMAFKWVGTGEAGGKRKLASSQVGTGYKEIYLTAKIEKNQLKNIPFGGVWKAKLALRQMRGGGGGGTKVGDVEVDITLKVSDKAKYEIYVAGSPMSNQRVDFGVLKGNGQHKEKKIIDMCLYDGANSQTKSFEITMVDGTSIAGRDKRNFSVVRAGTSGTDPKDRIDYRVSYVANAGGAVEVINGDKRVESNGASATVRTVHLHNVNTPVYCRELPISLETLPFSALEKNAGVYEGKLKFIFSPSAEFI